MEDDLNDINNIQVALDIIQFYLRELNSLSSTEASFGDLLGLLLLKALSLLPSFASSGPSVSPAFLS